MIIGFMGRSGSGKDTAGAELAKALGGTRLSFAAPMKKFCAGVLDMPQVWGSLKLKETPLSQVALLKAERAWKRSYERGASDRLFAAFGSIRTPLMDAFDVACGREILNVGELSWNGIRADNERALHQWWLELRKEKKLTPRRILQTFGTEFGRKHLGEDFWVDVGLEQAWYLLRKGTNAIVFTDVRFRNEVIALKRAGGLVARIYRREADTEKATHASEAEQESVPLWWLDRILHNVGSLDDFKDNVRSYAYDITHGRQ